MTADAFYVKISQSFAVQVTIIWETFLDKQNVKGKCPIIAPPWQYEDSNLKPKGRNVL